MDARARRLDSYVLRVFAAFCPTAETTCRLCQGRTCVRAVWLSTDTHWAGCCSRNLQAGWCSPGKLYLSSRNVAKLPAMVSPNKSTVTNLRSLPSEIVLSCRHWVLCLTQQWVSFATQVECLSSLRIRNTQFLWVIVYKGLVDTRWNL